MQLLLLRNLFLAGVPYARGTTVDVADNLAQQLIGAGEAVAVSANLQRSVGTAIAGSHTITTRRDSGGNILGIDVQPPSGPAYTLAGSFNPVQHLAEHAALGLGMGQILVTSGSALAPITLIEDSLIPITLTADTTIAIDSTAARIRMLFIQDSHGGRAVTLPSNIVWLNSAAPSIALTPNAATLIELYSPDSGVTRYGVAPGTGSGVPAYTVFDNFVRTDSTTTPGSAVTGQAWTVGSGNVFGINFGQAYTPATSSGVATMWIDTTKADSDIKADIAGLWVNGSPGVCFRLTDENNYLYFKRDNAGGYYLRKVIAGVDTLMDVVTDGNVGSGGGTAPVWDYTRTYEFRVLTAGTSIKCYIDGVLLLSFTSSQFQTNTKAGLFLKNSADATPRFLNFRVP